MHKDIREILRNNTENKGQLSTKHRARFQKKLQQELHPKKEQKNYQWLFVAASIVLLVSLAIRFVPFSDDKNQIKETNGKEKSVQQLSLGSISPELKTIEAYYTNTINYELSQLELTKDNKELFDGYLKQLEELTNEYQSLTDELNTKGVNDDTINALIGNLQLRLQLLKRMQKQLHEFKKPNQNDIQTI